ncbi:hypothetical protein CHARACLAT_012882 [Characodon lateralis]|uniref:Chloride channel CLIC-like protein 1 n=1 Tax=Characodon lateralis TaxID=208331 RepID=A0ABU7D153_9TELE|nr:hypothetical protein [Characodon lateralis]
MKIMSLAKPECDPVFKRFLGRLMKEVYKAGEPTDFNSIFYNAKIQLSRTAMVDIQSFLMGEDNWRTGALDDALRSILVELKPHNLEYTVGADLNPIFIIGVFFIIGLLLTCIQPCPRVSWFKQFKTMFAFCFFVSIPWNWFYLYKEAYAKHQYKILNFEKFYPQCTGQKESSLMDSLKDWYRNAFTLQDDPCEEYQKLISINPIFEVSPLKVVVYSLEAFFNEPLRAFGDGIDDNVSFEQNVIHQRQPNRTREELNIENIRSANPSQNDRVTDAEGCQGSPDEKKKISVSDSEDQQEIRKERWCSTRTSANRNAACTDMYRTSAGEERSSASLKFTETEKASAQQT